MVGKKHIAFIVGSFIFVFMGLGGLYLFLYRQISPKVSSSFLKTYENIVPVAIVGSGPAGLTAGLYTARSHLPTVVFAGPELGGQLTEARFVENWPAKQKERGALIMQELENQVKHFGAKIDNVSVTSIDLSKWPYTLELDTGAKVTALSVVLSTGGSQKTVDIPGVKEYWGKGIGVCTICDAPFDKGKVVGVLGDSDITCDMVLQLREFAKHVYVCVPKSRMEAAAVNQEYLHKADNVTVLLDVEVKQIQGDGNNLTGILVKDKSKGEEKTIPMESFYFAIGFKPNSSLVSGQVKTDDEGYIIVNPRNSTNKPLVYAAGTVIDPIYQKGLISSSMGAEAAISLIQDLQDAGFNSSVKEALKDKLYTVDELPIAIDMINTPQELADLVRKHELLFVNFFGPNCPACKCMLPVMQKAAREMEGIVKFVNFNIQEDYEIVDLFNLHHKPTFILFKRGKERDRIGGVYTKDELVEFVNDNK